MLHDHIALIVRSHTSYVLFDDVLNSEYDQDDNSDDEENNGLNPLGKSQKVQTLKTIIRENLHDKCHT